MAEESGVGESLISEYIEDYRELDISFDRMHLKEAVTFSTDSSGVTDGVILGETFIDKYRKDLLNLVITKTFTKEEIFKYRNNPWVLSYDLYGSVEYWQLLLDLNDMTSAVEFTRPTIKVYDDTLPDIIDAILMSEETFIDYNEEELNEALGINTEKEDDEEEEDEDE